MKKRIIIILFFVSSLFGFLAELNSIFAEQETTETAVTAAIPDEHTHEWEKLYKTVKKSSGTGDNQNPASDVYYEQVECGYKCSICGEVTN